MLTEVLVRLIKWKKCTVNVTPKFQRPGSTCFYLVLLNGKDGVIAKVLQMKMR
jgi:hypothetical protein